jgi:predicted nucleic acid-binding protein
MSLFEDVMSLAVQLPMTERERLARALGLNAHSRGAGKTLSLNAFVAQPAEDAASWRARETGHAVVDTRGVADANTIGPDAIFNLSSGAFSPQIDETLPLASSLPQGSPVVVAPEIVLALAAGDERAHEFWQSPPVELRLATASYLALLEIARDENETRRIGNFVQPFAVLSLGPMASSRAVELMTRRASAPLGALEALAAATALAHEIPLVAFDGAPYRGIAELQVVRPF